MARYAQRIEGAMLVSKTDLELAKNEGLCQNELARELGVARASVLRAERKHGISLRRAESRGKYGGERSLRNRVADMKLLDAVEYLLSIVESYSAPPDSMWTEDLPGGPYTVQETRLLWALASAQGRLLTKAQILDALYNDRPNDAPEMKIVDVFVCKVRKKLAGTGVVIETIWGRGYRLAVPPEINFPWPERNPYV